MISRHLLTPFNRYFKKFRKYSILPVFSHFKMIKCYGKYNSNTLLEIYLQVKLIPIMIWILSSNSNKMWTTIFIVRLFRLFISILYMLTFSILIYFNGRNYELVSKDKIQQGLWTRKEKDRGRFFVNTYKVAKTDLSSWWYNCNNQDRMKWSERNIKVGRV